MVQDMLVQRRTSPRHGLIAFCFVLCTALPSIAADIFMLPAKPFYFLDTDDISVRFRCLTVAQVKSVAIQDEAAGKWALPTVVYVLEPIRAAVGRRYERNMLVHGSYGYANGNTRYEVGLGEYEMAGLYSPGDVVALPLEPDPDMTPRNQEFNARNFGMPKGDYYRVQGESLEDDTPWDVAWSKLFMNGLVRYVELREQASRLEEGKRGRFWLDHVVPNENIYVRMQALWWLGQLEYEPAVSRIALAFTEGGDKHGHRMRRVAAEALRKFPPKTYVGHLGRLATHAEVQVRREAISLMAIWVKQDEAADFCERHMSDPDEEVRISVIGVAARHEVWDFVEEAKSDESPKVRKKAKALWAQQRRGE